MSPATDTRQSLPYERYRARLAGAMLFSLLAHALVLSLQLGLPGIGLPALELPWRDRRAQAVDLHVVLADAARVREADNAGAAPPVTETPVQSQTPPRAGLKLYVPPEPRARAAKGKTATAKKQKRAKEPPLVVRKPPVPAKKEQAVIALTESRPDTFVVPPPAPDEALPNDEPPAPPPPVEVAPEPAVTEQSPPDDQAAQALAEEERLRLEAEIRRQEALAREARQREEEEMREAAQRRAALALAQQEAQQRAEVEQRALALEARKREEQAKTEREALELEKRKLSEEEARRQAALALQQQRDAQRREQEDAARQAMELEAKRREEAQRLEAARLAREAAERQAQAEAELKRQAEELAARRKAEAEAATRRRDAELLPGTNPSAQAAPGPSRPGDALPRDLMGGGLASRALDQARRSDIFRSDAAPAADGNDGNTRRRSILGSVRQDVGLMMYVEGWRLKIERNGNLNYRQSSVDNARGDPVVTVAIRSDGSVEDIVIHRSSGRQELDEAVRRIVRLNARYSAFPPELARRFDVIEIRRIWNFDERLRILEEVR